MGYSHYSVHQIEILETINSICAPFSVIGSLFIIFSYLIFPNLRSRFAYSLVFFTAISDLIRSIGRIWGSFLSSDRSVQTQCSFAGLFINFGGVSSFIFTAVIAIVMYTCVHMQYASLWNVKPEILRRRKYYVAITIWMVTLIISCLPFINSGYAYVGAWCWISSEFHHWRWICFYGPLILICLFCIVMYTIIIRQLRSVAEAMDESNRGRLKFAMYGRLKYYPLVLVIAQLFPTTRRVYNQMFDEEAPFWLGVLHTLGAGLYGGLNAITYGICCLSLFIELRICDAYELYPGLNQAVTREYSKSLEGTIRSREMKVVQVIDLKQTQQKQTH
eukprot:198368_1